MVSVKNFHHPGDLDPYHISSCFYPKVAERWTKVGAMPP